MQKSFLWAAALGHSDEEVTSWAQQATDGDVLQWALENQKIDSNKYLTWASNHYQLSRVSEEFFSNGPLLKKEDWSKSKLEWKASLYPIYAWEDTLFIGCLEPPVLDTTAELQQPSLSFVLCPADALRKNWPQPDEAQDTDETASLDSLSSLPNLFGETSPSQNNDEDVSGISLANMEVDFSSLGGLAAADSNPPSESSTEAPTNQIPIQSEQPLNDSNSVIDLGPISVVQETKAPQDIATQEPASSSAIEINMDSIQIAPVQDDALADAVIDTPSAISEITPPANTEFSSQTTPWSEKVFEQMDLFFDAKMIIEKTSDGFLPKHWDGPWKMKNPATCPFVNIKEPNIFSIAHNSKRPFHGAVSKNSINDAFFEFWSASEYPQEITISPVLQGNDVIAMVVGIARDSDEQSKKLQLVFNVGQKVHQNLRQVA